MRLFEIELTEAIKRKKPISLRWLNARKMEELKRQRSFDERSKLMQIMYAHEDPRDAELKRIEIEKERLELKRLQAEYQALLDEPHEKAMKAIERMSRSEMTRRKKKL